MKDDITFSKILFFIVAITALLFIMFGLKCDNKNTEQLLDIKPVSQPTIEGTGTSPRYCREPVCDPLTDN
tara:strand:+ start:11215 stop:11424 length:210 start_codon:yes stop_codon:yes gene_type:complete